MEMRPCKSRGSSRSSERGYARSRELFLVAAGTADERTLISGLRWRLDQAKLVDQAIGARPIRTLSLHPQRRSSAPNSHGAATRPSTAPAHKKSPLAQRTRPRARMPVVECEVLPAYECTVQPSDATATVECEARPDPNATMPPGASENDDFAHTCDNLTSARHQPAGEAAAGACCRMDMLADVLRIVLAQETNRSALVMMSASLPKVTRMWKGSQLMQHAPWSSINLLELVFGPAARRPGPAVQRVVEVLQAAGPAAASMSGELRAWWPVLHHGTVGSRRFFFLGLRHQQFYETGLHETGLRIWPLNFFLVQFLWSTPELVVGRACLELGAGVGVLSVAAIALKPSLYVATEISTRCRKLMAINMAMNSCSADVALVSSLKFSRRDAQSFIQGQPSHLFGFHSKQPLPTAKYSTVVGCEIVYEDDVIGPLWAAIKELLAETKDSVFVLGYYLRSLSLQDDLLTQAAVSGFCCEEVPPEQYLPLDASNDFLKRTLQIASDEEWTSAFMNNWQASHFHIYLFRWAHLCDTIPSVFRTR